jgi:hypothetical protein
MPDFIKTTDRCLMQLKHIAVRSAGAVSTGLAGTDSSLGHVNGGNVVRISAAGHPYWHSKAMQFPELEMNDSQPADHGGKPGNGYVCIW